MLLPNVYFVPLKPVDKKPLIVAFSEFCSKLNPKPFYCELPDDTKSKSVTASGTLETYSVASTATASTVGTTTTTL